MIEYELNKFGRIHTELKDTIRYRERYGSKANLPALERFVNEINALKKFLSDKGSIWNGSGFDLSFKELEYPLTALRGYLSLNENYRLNENDALIF